MTDYFVRPGGDDGHTGTGPAAADAWLTIGKALGAAGISSGDTVWVAPGTYRECVTLAMTSATVETFVIGDVAASQFTDLQGGDVIWTAYTTNDKTAPASLPVLALNGRDFLSFQDLMLVGGNDSMQVLSANTATSTNIKFTRCLFQTGGKGFTYISYTALVDAASNVTFDSCIFSILTTSNGITITLPTSASADYDAEIMFKNCLLLAPQGTGVPLNITASGANAFKGGGVKVYNCTWVGGSSCIATASANVATSAGNQCEVYNSVLISSAGTGLNVNASGQIVEDYNYIIASTPRTNVSIGTHSISTSTSLTYALLVHLGQEQLWGQQPRPFFSPMLQSPLLGFGNDGSIGVQTQDAFGVPRPAGPARTWAGVGKAIGYSERPNTAQRETSIVKTGSNALSLTGPSCQDFELPVAATSTTASAYVRWDSTYTGTKPKMQVLGGAECGVADATATATGVADNASWEQLSLNFTPSKAGIVTIRFLSSDTNGGGKMFVDDFSVA